MRHRWISVCLCFTLLVASSALGGVCDSEYTTVVLALGKARMPQGPQQKTVSKVDNARRLSRGSAPNSRTDAIKQLDQALQLLDSTATKDVSAETRTMLRTAITAYSACLSSAPAVQNVQVTVRVSSVGDTPGSTVPAGKDVEIRVDGEITTQTKQDGTATVTVPAGEHTFAAVSTVSFGASSVTEVMPPSATVELIMGPGGDFAFPAALQIDELADSVIQPAFGSFTVRFLDADGTTIKLKSLTRLELTSTGGELTDLRPSFSLKGTGEMTATNVAALGQILNDRFGPYELTVSASDNASHLYRGRIRFDLGRYTASGAVRSPAAVAVPLANIPVRLTNDRSGFVFWGTTGANGALTFPALMPEGVYLVYCDTVYQSVRYYCADAFVLNANRNFSLRLFAVAGPAAEPISQTATTQAQ